jgi:hypothetical protein
LAHSSSEVDEDVILIDVLLEDQILEHKTIMWKSYPMCDQSTMTESNSLLTK